MYTGYILRKSCFNQNLLKQYYENQPLYYFYFIQISEEGSSINGSFKLSTGGLQYFSFLFGFQRLLLPLCSVQLLIQRLASLTTHNYKKFRET